jgi:hypothetical protein
MRASKLAAGLAGLALVLAACSSGGDADSDAAQETAEATAAETTEEEAATETTEETAEEAFRRRQHQDRLGPPTHRRSRG